MLCCCRILYMIQIPNLIWSNISCLEYPQACSGWSENVCMLLDWAVNSGVEVPIARLWLKHCEYVCGQYYIELTYDSLSVLILPARSGIGEK